MKQKTLQQLKTEQYNVVTDGQCEHCGYDYSNDHVTIPVDEFMAKCPKCGKYSMNYNDDLFPISPEYDYEKENNKKCPVCGQIIDYHIAGFIHYEKENVWIHREHTAAETEKALQRLTGRATLTGEKIRRA